MTDVYCAICKTLTRRDHFKKRSTDKGQIRFTCPKCGETEVAYPCGNCEGAGLENKEGYTACGGSGLGGT